MNTIPNQSTIVNSKELFPQLAGLKGGKKQAWINANLDTISALSEIVPFDSLCEALHCKADTLARALRHAETKHRPAVTAADKAMLEAQRASNKASMAISELAVQSSALAGLSADLDDMAANLSQYFGMMAQASTMMQKLMSRPNRYHSFHNIYLVRTASKSVQLSKSKVKSGSILDKRTARLLLSTPGRSQLPGQGVKGVSRRQYRHNARRSPGRWPYV